VGELPLMSGTTPGDPTRNDLPALGHEIAETADVLVIDEVHLVRAELADLPPAKPPALEWLLGCGNG